MNYNKKRRARIFGHITLMFAALAFMAFAAVKIARTDCEQELKQETVPACTD
jgi:hypothetical protein